MITIISFAVFVAAVIMNHCCVFNVDVLKQQDGGWDICFAYVHRASAREHESLRYDNDVSSEVAGQVYSAYEQRRLSWNDCP